MFRKLVRIPTNQTKYWFLVITGIPGYKWRTSSSKKKTRTDKLNPLESQNNTGISFAFFWLRMWRNIYHKKKEQSKEMKLNQPIILYMYGTNTLTARPAPRMKKHTRTLIWRILVKKIGLSKSECINALQVWSLPKSDQSLGSPLSCPLDDYNGVTRTKEPIQIWYDETVKIMLSLAVQGFKRLPKTNLFKIVVLFSSWLVLC